MKFQMGIPLLNYQMNINIMQRMFVGHITVKIYNLMQLFQIKMILKAKYFKKLPKFHMEKLEPTNRSQNPLEPELTEQLELQLVEIRFQ